LCSQRLFFGDWGHQRNFSRAFGKEEFLADSSFTHLVVAGPSAGGIGTLSGLVTSLPEDFDAPIVVAQHLDPNRESHLQEILARKSPLPVKTVTEHELLQAGVMGNRILLPERRLGSTGLSPASERRRVSWRTAR
jgi:chemotaxis response regulator CheB